MRGACIGIRGKSSDRLIVSMWPRVVVREVSTLEVVTSEALRASRSTSIASEAIEFIERESHTWPKLPWLSRGFLGAEAAGQFSNDNEW